MYTAGKKCQREEVVVMIFVGDEPCFVTPTREKNVWGESHISLDHQGFDMRNRTAVDGEMEAPPVATKKSMH